MAKCPDWIFDIVSTRTLRSFCLQAIHLKCQQIFFVRRLIKIMMPLNQKALLRSLNRWLRFLSEINAGEEAVIFLNDFIYFRMNYETKTKNRNLKPLFGNPEEGAAQS